MKHKNISEGVLDVTDEEGWLAKSQLYNIAKDAGELHQLIGDTDQLEAWMQAKITKAADYMAAVKNYIEYNMVSSAEAVQVVDIVEVAQVVMEEVDIEAAEEYLQERKMDINSSSFHFEVVSF